MTTTKIETYTTAGAKTEIDVSTPSTLSFAILADDGSISADAEVKLTENGNWHKAFTSIPNNEVKVTNGAVIAIRLNIIALNAATTVTWEVLGERQ